MTDTIKITSLSPMGTTIPGSSLTPVVDMSGTPTTKKATIANIANAILSQAGNGYAYAAKANLANIAGQSTTVTQNAQPNITSVGTLTSLTVSGETVLGPVGNVVITGGTNGYVLQTDGTGNLSWTAQTGGGGGNGTPGGANTQVQFNDAGSFGGDPGLTFNKTTNDLTVSGNVISTEGNVTANWVIGDYISGNATPLHHIPGANVTGFVPNANVANTAFAVAAANVSGLGNIATINLTGSSSNILYGNGAFAPPAVVTPAKIANGTSNVNIPTSSGAVEVTAGTQHWAFGTDGTLTAPNDSQIVPAGNNFNIYTNGVNGAVQFFTDVTGNNHNWAFDGYGYTQLPFSQGYTNTAVITTVGAGNLMLQAGAGPTQNFLFGSDGNLTLPTNTSSINYANGDPYGGGGANTGNVTFDGNVVQGTASYTGLGLSASPDDTANLKYLQVRAGDIDSHIHFDTGNYQAYDQYFGDDNKYLKLEKGLAGNVLIGAYQDGGIGQLHWTFDSNGNLVLPENGRIKAAGNTVPFTSTITNITTGSATVVVTMTDSIFPGPIIGQVQISDVVGTTEANNTWWYQAVDSNQFQLYYDEALTSPVDGTSWTAYVSGGNAVSTVSTMTINAGNVTVDTGLGSSWTFNTSGNVIFPTLTVDLHNGGNQTAQTLQFGDPEQQVIITGPTPAVDNNAQRLIIQGQRGNGTGEGGDVYVWAGDATNNGGDIKIYAGDADDGATAYGGYINLDGGSGFTSGGQITVTGGYSSGGAGGQITITPGSSGNAVGSPLNLNGGQSATTDGGNVNITAGYGQGNGGQVTITGGQSALGLPGYGNVVVQAGASGWTFDNGGNLTVPGEGIIQSINDTVILRSVDSNSNIYSARLGTNGGLYFETTAYPTGWLSLTNNSGNANITAATGTAGGAGKHIIINAGDADQSDFYTSAGGNINIKGGLGAFNDGGGGGPGGSINLIAGNSSDPAGHAGNINITSGSNDWVFDYTGNLNLPGNSFAVNYANGTPVTFGAAALGNVTFDNVTVQGVNGLNLSAGSDFTANLAYLQVRAGDVASHIHLDTGNNSAYDLILGDDQNYVQVSSTGNILLSAYDSNTAQYTWTLDYNGNLILAGGNSVIQSIANSSLDPLNPNVSTMVLTPDQGYNSQALVLDPTAPGHIHLRAPGANIDEPSANIFLGGEESSFEVGYYTGSAPNVFVHSGNNTWTFDNSGGLSFPRDAGGGTDPYLVISGGTNPAISSVDVSLAGPANLQLVSDYLNLSGYTGAKVVVRADDGEIMADANMVLTTNNANVGNEYSWTFDTAGNLTLPGNTFAVNYANGTQVSLGSYGNSNVVSLLSSFGSNTISTTGNISTGAVTASGKIGYSTGGTVTQTGTGQGVTLNQLTGEITLAKSSWTAGDIEVFILQTNKVSTGDYIMAQTINSVYATSFNVNAWVYPLLANSVQIYVKALESVTSTPVVKFLIMKAATS